MHDLRLNEFLALDPLETRLRRWLSPWREEFADPAPQIRIEVREADGSYAVKAEIPGVRKEDIDVRIDGKLVTISAEHKQDKEEPAGSRLLRSECQYGFASRSFTLADAVDEAKADAKYKDGVLQLTLPKRVPAAQQRLTID